MYILIVLFVIMVAGKVKSQGDSYITLTPVGQIGAVRVNSTITLTCDFRKTSNTVGIAVHAIDENGQATVRRTWKDTEVSYRDAASREGYVQYTHKVTESKTLQCKMWQYDPPAATISNNYTLHIWRAQLKNFPVSFKVPTQVTVDCSVEWTQHHNIDFTWYLGETRLPNGQPTRTYNGDSTYNVTSSLAHTFNKKDDGKYLKCEAKDQEGQGLNSVVQRQVRFVTVLRPSIEHFPGTFAEGEPMSVNCSVRGVSHTDIMFTWYLILQGKHGDLAMASHTEAHIQNHDNTFDVTSSLNYRARKEDDSKYLRCVAQDEHDSRLNGKADQILLLSPTTTPTTPRTTQASTIHETTVRKTRPRSTTPTTTAPPPGKTNAVQTTRLITPSTALTSTISESTVENTTTNSTIVDGQEGHQIRLYIFLAVGVTAVVAVVICCYVFKKKQKKEMGERRNTMESTRQTALTHNEQAHQAHLKQQGMVYADLEMVKAENAKTTTPEASPPPVIRGIENQVEYASLTWDKNKKAKGKNGGQK